MAKNIDGMVKGKTDLKRSMKSRHLMMIGIGGAIGTGLWFASGSVVSGVGPGGAMLVFALMGALVYLLMTGLGEMATKVPLSGSFETYASKFIDPALGFAVGWNYYLSWAVTVTFEIVVGVIALQYWFPDVPTWIPSIIFFCLLFGLNFASARVFGESEYWFSSLKVITVVIFLIVGAFLIIKGCVTPDGIGFSNWTHTATDGPLAGESGPFPTGIGPIVSFFLIAAFSFQGTELVGLSAGEAENPEKSIPRAINSVFWRILLFYIGGMFVIGTLVPFDDPHLQAAMAADYETDPDAVGFSPFTLVFNNAGFGWAASFMNIVFMTSVLSCGNSGLFCATRMLYGMANEGKAPRIFALTNKRGVPVNALLVTAGIAAIGFFTSLAPQIDIYTFLLNASGMMGMFGWVAIALCHYRFRRAYLAQGNSLDDLHYKAKFFPVGAICAIILCTVVVLTAEMWVFEDFQFGTFLTWYWPLFTFGGCYLIYKLVMKTKLVKLEEASFAVEYDKVERK